MSTAHNPQLSSSHPAIGTLIDEGSLQLVEVLGVGCYGATYRAVEAQPTTVIPRSYTIKCLVHPMQKPRSESRSAHIREITLHQLASKHPGIITLHRVVESSNLTFMVLDYAPDHDLSTQIHHNYHYLNNNTLIKHVFLQLLDAVEYCHSLGIYHRDLRPGNVLCYDGGHRIAVTNFGLATTEKVSEDVNPGSEFYMSPECQGAASTLQGSYSPMHNDIWSLGIILFYLVTGRNPWKSANTDDLSFQAYLCSPTTFLSSVFPISSEVNKTLLGMLDVDYRRRTPLRRVRRAIQDVATFYSDGASPKSSMTYCPREPGVGINTDFSENTNPPHPYSSLPLPVTTTSRSSKGTTSHTISHFARLAYDKISGINFLFCDVIWVCELVPAVSIPTLIKQASWGISSPWRSRRYRKYYYTDKAIIKAATVLSCTPIPNMPWVIALSPVFLFFALCSAGWTPNCRYTDLQILAIRIQSTMTYITPGVIKDRMVIVRFWGYAGATGTHNLYKSLLFIRLVTYLFNGYTDSLVSLWIFVLIDACLLAAFTYITSTPPNIVNIRQLVTNKKYRPLLLRFRGHDAQCIADAVNTVLRKSNDITLQEQKNTLSLLYKLAETALVFPRCFELKGVQRAPELLEGGGFADVHKGVYKKQVVCVKMIRIFQKDQHHPQTRHQLAMYVKELSLWASLSHQNILPFYGAYIDRQTQRPCLVSPWMENGNLCDYLDAYPCAPRSLLVSDISYGLGYLHDLEIVHGDLKGKNVLISDAGRALIADFGISRAAMSTGYTKSFKGTIRWSAPELLLGDNDDDGREIYALPTLESDIWSFSCVCYEVFTGKVPFYQYPLEPQVTFILYHRRGVPIRPSDGPDDVMWNMMEACWNYTPQERPTCKALQSFFSRLGLWDIRPRA